MRREYPLAVEVVVVISLQDFLNGLFILEDDETEASRAHGFMVVHDVGFNDLAKLLEVAFEYLVVDCQRKASHEHFALLLSGKLIVGFFSRQVLFHINLSSHDPVVLHEDGARDVLVECHDRETLGFFCLDRVDDFYTFDITELLKALLKVG